MKGDKGGASKTVLLAWDWVGCDGTLSDAVCADSTEVGEVLDGGGDDVGLVTLVLVDVAIDVNGCVLEALDISSREEVACSLTSCKAVVWSEGGEGDSTGDGGVSISSSASESSGTAINSSASSAEGNEDGLGLFSSTGVAAGE